MIIERLVESILVVRQSYLCGSLNCKSWNPSGASDPAPPSYCCRYLTEVEQDLQIVALLPPHSSGDRISTPPLGSMHGVFIGEYPSDERKEKPVLILSESVCSRESFTTELWFQD